MNNKLANIIFVLVLILLSFVVLFKFAKNSNEYNYVDNRLSYRFEKPMIKNILSGEFQKNIEDAAADQIPKYGFFKTIYIKISNYINIKTMSWFKYNRYIRLGNVNFYKDYLLYGNVSYDYFVEIANDDINEINNINNNTDSNVYLYFIETDSLYDFENNNKIDVYEYLKDNLNIDESNISKLNIDSFANYKKYFYRADHHWNYRGSYKGYEDIAGLMNLSHVLVPEESVCFDDIKFSGSKGQSVGSISMFNEKACMYNFNFPEYETYISLEKVADYGSSYNVLKDLEEISYGAIYGYNYDIIKFINNQSNNDKKLLIYSNSYTNAINKLLASHYRETFVIDGRHFSDSTVVEYINNNNIDDVLIIGNYMLFSDEKKW